MLNIPGSIGISPIYVADVRITYQFNRTNNEFLVEQIDVKPIENKASQKLTIPVISFWLFIVEVSLGIV